MSFIHILDINFLSDVLFAKYLLTTGLDLVSNCVFLVYMGKSHIFHKYFLGNI